MCGEGDAAAVDGGGEIGAEARHGGEGRALAGVGVGAAVGDAGPAGGVVVAGVVGAEAFDEAGLAGVAVLAEPGVPAGAGGVGGRRGVRRQPVSWKRSQAVAAMGTTIWIWP